MYLKALEDGRWEEGKKGKGRNVIILSRWTGKEGEGN
jgi:hypothetical protein